MRPVDQARNMLLPYLQDVGRKLQDADARLSELVWHARTEGPQCVTLRGREAVVGIAADELETRLPPTAQSLPFVAFMKTLEVDGLDSTRDWDTSRNVFL